MLKITVLQLTKNPGSPSGPSTWYAGWSAQILTVGKEILELPVGPVFGNIWVAQPFYRSHLATGRPQPSKRQKTGPAILLSLFFFSGTTSHWDQRYQWQQNNTSLRNLHVWSSRHFRLECQRLNFCMMYRWQSTYYIWHWNLQWLALLTLSQDKIVVN